MIVSDMYVKDDAQNVEMKDIEDQSSYGNNSWDIVVFKATYIFQTILVITLILNNFLHCVFLKY
jgi:hypothetical protein